VQKNIADGEETLGYKEEKRIGEIVEVTLEYLDQCVAFWNHKVNLPNLLGNLHLLHNYINN
jgi:hypothetical protein